MSTTQRHTITAALPYANGPLHIGHIAGAYLPADIYARFLKLKGDDVAFICGSDEHGAAITIRAKKEGISPQEIIDKYHSINKKAFEDFGIAFDIFHRTSDPLHHATAQEFFLQLEKNGAFTKESSEQFYDEEHQQFLADRYIIGTCPKCGNENAYGDQCEKCGTSLNPTDLIHPKSTLSGKSPVLRKTEHWYLPMERHENWIREWIEKGTLDGHFHHDPKAWKSHVVGQCKSWIDAGLQPRAMTRDLDWGVKVPIEGADGKVLYVWLDAPIGYISATKQWASDNNKNWEDYWKNPETRLIHFIGKDNIVFHCIIFPILLKAHQGFLLPENVPANEFLNLEGDKISTSRNWAVWLHEYMEDLPGKQDELRYVLGSIAPETKDSEFTWKDYQARVNNELVAIFGNFVNRVLVLIQKYYNGTVPSVNQPIKTEAERELFTAIIPENIIAIEDNIGKYKFREALQSAMNIAREGNKYLADTEPWKLIKTDEERTKEILFNALQLVAKLNIVFRPFLPFTCQKLEKMLESGHNEWKDLQLPVIIESGKQLPEPGLLFEKIEDALIETQSKKLDESRKAYKASTVQAKTQKADVSFDDFSKMDIRVGTIIAAEKVEKANKLLKLKVDTGIDQRTVVSGIAEHYSPEEIIGQQVSILVNLAPRNIRGVESQGMILMAENQEGKLCFVSPSKLGFNPGSEIR
ncbi:MAG: methionine--tRNA ligase [Flavobacteriales bacterium]|nr:methionine--tRNA ligase [Flavobacteriales bacterium]